MGGKNMKKISIISLALTSLLYNSVGYASQKIEEVEMYEIKSYDPKSTGLKDLVFEARIEHLTDLLNKKLSIGKLTDVHFKIYWISPTQYKVDVIGLKKGFQEIKSELANLIKGKLEFIIPEKFSEKFKGYTLSAEPIADGKLIRAIDETYTMSVSEVDIKFAKNGLLKSVDSKSPMSKISTEFYQSPKSWSNNKQVLDKTVSTSYQGGVEIVIENEIDYKLYQGVGLPSKISIKNTSSYMKPAHGKEKARKVSEENVSNIIFSKYELNTGKARKEILEGL